MNEASDHEDKKLCTCHPDDNPPLPCPHKYALTECRKAAVEQFEAMRAAAIRKIMLEYYEAKYASLIKKYETARKKD